MGAFSKKLDDGPAVGITECRERIGGMGGCGAQLGFLTLVPTLVLL
jgi:hypothetical protein